MQIEKRQTLRRKLLQLRGGGGDQEPPLWSGNFPLQHAQRYFCSKTHRPLPFSDPPPMSSGGSTTRPPRRAMCPDVRRAHGAPFGVGGHADGRRTRSHAAADLVPQEPGDVISATKKLELLHQRLQMTEGEV